MRIGISAWQSTLWTAIVLALTTGEVRAGYILTDTLMVPVIFYDFHADGSNPNFEPSGGCGNAKGMVQDTLDSDRKPALKADVCFNDRIDEWCRPSGRPADARFIFDSSREIWRWTAGTLKPYGTVPGDSVGINFNPGYDMANVVIHDSLPFELLDSATGSYNFTRSQKPGFFWLDGRGFGEEPAGSGHNFSFTMELHDEFTYLGGEYFQFSGDDGVWVFIDGQLVVDLGGMQKEVKVNLDVDALARRRSALSKAANTCSTSSTRSARLHRPVPLSRQTYLHPPNQTISSLPTTPPLRIRATPLLTSRIQA